MDKTLDNSTANRDPLTGAPGAHPVGTGVGAAVGGAAVGAIVGGLAGKGVAEKIDPTMEDDYWRENYSSRPYVNSGDSYDDYGPAYGYGVASYQRLAGSSFDDAEPDLARGWNDARGHSSLEWDRARGPVRDAWTRVSDSIERAVPGDSDRDGK